MNKWLFWLWLFPGIPVSIYLRNSVAWIVFLSVYAIIIAHLIEWRQEDEDSDKRESTAPKSQTDGN